MFDSKRQSTVSKVVCGIYLILLVWLILFKFNVNITDLDHSRSVNLIPFGESMIVNGQLELREIIFNVLVFVPFGVYISMFKANWSFLKKIIPCLLLSLGFEAFQFIFAIGASDITDMIGNTLGGMAGIGLYYLFKKLFRNRSTAIINGLGFAIEILAILMLAIIFAANM